MKSNKQFILEEKYQGKRGLRFYIDLLKLYLGIPVAYIIGTQPFLKLQIKLKHRVLIPRPETEFWLKKYVIDKLPGDEKMSILDIFSGTGCLGLALAQEFPLSNVTLTDKNKKFVKLIKENADLNRLQNIEAIHSDIFSEIPKKKYDLILANPPYISFFKFNFSLLILLENWRSLFAKDRGLFFIKKMLKYVDKYMNDNGVVFIEFDPWQRDIIEGLLQKKYRHFKYKFLKDQYDKYRVLSLSLA